MPYIEVVGDPQPPFVLKSFSTSFNGRVDPPFLGRRELPDEIVLNEELDGLFAQVAGRKGPHGRSFSRDLDGDILDGLLGHPVVIVRLRLVVASHGRLQSERLPE